MNDPSTDTPAARRAAWLGDLRLASERQEDDLAADYDANWGEVEPTQVFVERFLAKLPPAGRVLDAACGTGKYFGAVLAGGRSLLGVDHSAAALRRAAAKWPQVPTGRHALQELLFRAEFDGVVCVDAMEMVPPEDWPGVLDRFRQALRPGGWLYLTVELARDDEVRAVNQRLRAAGLPAGPSERTA
jgi:SAM-dependent methyltransferase